MSTEYEKSAIVEAMHVAAIDVLLKAYPKPSQESLQQLQDFVATAVFNMCELMGGEAGSAFIASLAEVVSENKGEIDKKRARSMQRANHMH